MVLTNNLQGLYDFIDKAETNRNYPPNVATNFKTPLNLVEKELTEEEKNSIDLLKKNLDQIINTIYSKSGNKLSASSLEIYKRRMKNLIEDYENYGKDPSKMATWNRKTLIRKPKERKVVIKENVIDSPADFSPSFESSEFQAADLVLSSGRARIIVPKEISPDDAKKLKFQIDLLANIFPEDKISRGSVK